ncbi:oxidoreductase [Agrobacterium sp. ICMP 6402]|uniref:oxidoreductase n=1 Tax=Agrobacterium sp. ICMP 6402 TaxID=2292443 RepID=UPI001295A09F|nr:oxidoreductase [Agrobacterium sp. ICMP 6402]MQB12437.1 oxidoreductase [Agrobacterium sp. ICMP 6402]
MSKTPLFTPLSLGPVTLPNRIAVAPMCQYMANDGSASAWHTQHLMTLGMSGAGLVMIEATAVSRQGRITHGCLGLYSDASEDALGTVLDQARRVALPGTEFGIQLSHAGRKGSAHRPWETPGGSLSGRDAWETLAPSDIAHRDGWARPRAATDEDLEQIAEDFRSATVRATRLGFKVIEVHIAHGYLLHQFHSPLSNRRNDGWGGDAEKRMAFPLHIAQTIRAETIRHAASGVAVGARITGSDWAGDGLATADAIALAMRLRAAGLDYACVTSSGIPVSNPTVANPDLEQLELAAAVRRESGITTRAVGLITGAQQANDIIESGKADQVAVGRAFLDDPRWGWHSAFDLGVTLPYPSPYAWAAPSNWSGLEHRRG